MGEVTGIEWCDHTFNPWIGCTAVSAACDHCYAETLVKRWGGDFATRRRTAPANWQHPLRWDRKAEAEGRRARVFCSSLADVFDNQVEIGWLVDLLVLIRATPNLDWLLLTKRPQNIRKRLRAVLDVVNTDPRGLSILGWVLAWLQGAAPANVWLGTTAEDQTEFNRRVPHLQAMPAAVRFLSCEPLLGPIDLGFSLFDLNAPVHWVIAGGESGPGARPMRGDWVRSLRAQCAEAEAAFFFKQWGEWAPEAMAFRSAYTPDRWHEWPGHHPISGLPEASARFGKKVTGSLLDRVAHKAFPEGVHAP